jgi:hypothetical protein
VAVRFLARSLTHALVQRSRHSLRLLPATKAGGLDGAARRICGACFSSSWPTKGLATETMRTVAEYAASLTRSLAERVRVSEELDAPNESWSQVERRHVGRSGALNKQ